MIEVKNLGKKYKIGAHQPYLALRDTLTNIAKSPFHWLKDKTVQQKKSRRSDFWALKDIHFSVEEGDVVGIIGRNGSGKSTLLKILSQITPPTEGQVTLRGRVGSLLEVGTGFHPELSGRENVYLNGAILGMRKKEIEKKFDEIVEFSGVEKFLDTPVKRYSSGMQVRLAFSVAAHLDPEILMIDEVLTVGDIEFQKKCLDRMGKITRTDGKTILFVSHNISAVQSLCSKTIWLEKAKIRAMGKTEDVVRQYLEEMNGSNSTSMIEFPADEHKEMSFLKFWITDNAGNMTNVVGNDTQTKIWINLSVHIPIDSADVAIAIINSKGVVVTVVYLSDMQGGKLVSFQKGTYTMSASIPPNFLVPDYYSLRIWSYIGGVKNIDYSEGDIGFRVEHLSSIHSIVGCVFKDVDWNLKKIR